MCFFTVIKNILKMGKGHEETLFQRQKKAKIEMVKKHMKRLSILLVIREMPNQNYNEILLYSHQYSHN